MKYRELRNFLWEQEMVRPAEMVDNVVPYDPIGRTKMKGGKNAFKSRIFETYAPRVA